MSSDKRLHFIVEIHGKDTSNKATLQVLSHHATVQSGMTALCRVMEQWTASHGAIPFGTQGKLKDVRDGGTVFEMTYLGYEENTLLGR